MKQISSRRQKSSLVKDHFTPSIEGAWQAVYMEVLTAILTQMLGTIFAALACIFIDLSAST